MTPTPRRAFALFLLAMAAAACSGAVPGGDPPGAPGSPTEPAGSPVTDVTGPEQTPAAGVSRVDPREDGLAVSLGEWAVTLEADAIRPGRVTFVVTNRGTVPHGFEIETEDLDEDEGGVKAETRLLQPGETTRLTLDLPPGLYKVECSVEGHDDRGMERLLEVRRDAPLVRAEGGDTGTEVAARGFAFVPASLEVPAGSTVEWTNADPARHTVTAEDGAFDSGVLEQGASFSLRIDETGVVRYLCAIHPEMRARIVVTEG